MGLAQRYFDSRLAVLVLSLFLVTMLLPAQAFAQHTEKTIRVGWFESPFNTTDEVGRKSGYSYDYQQQIAAYTGWSYEYVTGSWPDLLQMLIEGRIDLLSDVSYTPERSESMLFSSLPMGTEQYYLFTVSNNREISSDDYSSINGKRVGVNKGSIQINYFREWAADNGVEAEIVELTGTEDENFDKLASGKIDLYLALDSFNEGRHAIPVCKVGSSDFFFAVNKNEPELLTELNAAMGRIQDENQYYNLELYSKYLHSPNANLFLNPEETEWIAEHGPIRVGYQDNYLAFCAQDPETGELTGALKDYLDVASSAFSSASLEFEPVCYPNAATALEAVKNGDVDCMFPSNLTLYDGESQGFFITPPLMSTDMLAVVREDDQKTFAKKDRVTVAVNAGNPNYELFLLDHFPTWRPIYYKDTPEGLRAIADGRTDCLLISNYRFNNISALCNEYHLGTISTGVTMDYCFALGRDDTTLYSILSKVTDSVPSATVNSSLSYHYTQDAKTNIIDLFKQNMLLVVGAIGLVALVITVLMLYRLRGKKAEANRA